MIYPKEYFDIQIKFAERASLITRDTTENLLFNYTNLYKIVCGRNGSFDSENPVWRNFLEVLNTSDNKAEAAYSFYLTSEKDDDNAEKGFGCFSYFYNEKDKLVRVHYRGSGLPGALKKENIELRKEELKEMFSDVKNKHPEAESVMGFSWLYNIEAYKRLFPMEYSDNPDTVKDWFKSLALWGQFFDASGNLRKEKVNSFLKKIEKAETLDELCSSFEYLVLKVKTDIKYFYKFYSIT